MLTNGKKTLYKTLGTSIIYSVMPHFYDLGIVLNDGLFSNYSHSNIPVYYKQHVKSTAAIIKKKVRKTSIVAIV